MRKFLNLSLLLFFLVVSGSLGCRSWFGYRDNGLDEPVPTDEMGWERYFEEAEDTQTEVTPLPAQEQMKSIPSEEQEPSESMSDMIVVSKVGSSVISRTYPWPECGIVQLDKVMPKEIGLNKPFNYTIKITNLTDATLNNIIVKEQIPGNFNFVNSNPTAKREENTLVWVLDSLEPKAIRHITVTGMANYAETLQHCTTVLTPVVPACTSVDVIEPRLRLTKNAPYESLLCDPVTFKYTVSNEGTGTVPNVRVMESLPTGLRTAEGKNDLIFEAGNLGPNQLREFSIELHPARTGKYISKAVASSTSGLRAESNETTTIVGVPILSISKTGPEKLYIGRPVSYEIIVSNVSEVPARDMVVEDIIPEGMTAVKATAGAKLTDSKLIWELGTLAPNSSKTLRISYTPTKPGTLMNGATATAYCAEAVTASVKTVITGIPAVMLEVIDLEDPVRIGNRAAYMITVTNQGSATSTNIRIACILENNVQYISSAGATASSVVGDTVRFLPLSSLAPKDKAVWRVVVAAVRPGDVRFKVIMNSDELTRPVEESEATHLYE
jgi:uncharacterized repeat protein (TIGR01451 family)